MDLSQVINLIFASFIGCIAGIITYYWPNIINKIHKKDTPKGVPLNGVHFDQKLEPMGYDLPSSKPVWSAEKKVKPKPYREELPDWPNIDDFFPPPPKQITDIDILRMKNPRGDYLWVEAIITDSISYNDVRKILGYPAMTEKTPEEIARMNELMYSAEANLFPGIIRTNHILYGDDQPIGILRFKNPLSTTEADRLKENWDKLNRVYKVGQDD